MTTRILSKAILLLTISLGVPTVARPAHAAGVHAVQGRRHHHRRHERRKERHREEREHAHDHDGERHGEL